MKRRVIAITAVLLIAGGCSHRDRSTAPPVAISAPSAAVVERSVEKEHNAESDAFEPASSAQSDNEAARAEETPVESDDAPTPEPLSESELAKIRAAIVEASIAEYDGNCPCPYHTMRNGRRCGGNSAYEREGGEAPLCYETDVTREMVQTYVAGQH